MRQCYALGEHTLQYIGFQLSSTFHHCLFLISNQMKWFILLEIFFQHIFFNTQEPLIQDRETRLLFTALIFNSPPFNMPISSPPSPNTCHPKLCFLCFSCSHTPQQPPLPPPTGPATPLKAGGSPSISFHLSETFMTADV